MLSSLLPLMLAVIQRYAKMLDKRLPLSAVTLAGTEMK
jgi:hypothetical protein